MKRQVKVQVECTHLSKYCTLTFCKQFSGLKEDTGKRRMIINH